MSVPEHTFRNLCRSSPWRWQSLRFDLVFTPAAQTGSAETGPAETSPEGTVPEPVGPLRCWLRRPQALRVESPDGALLHSTTGINDSKDSLFISGSRKPWLLPAHLVTPVYDDDGLVRRRPEAAYGEPRFGDPRFAALLDPVELAGNAPVALDFPFANVAELTELAAVDHEDRRALEATATANPGYVPLDPSGPLLYPGRTKVRIDTGTGVCVASMALDGGNAGAGHWLRILGVDEYMLDDLFTETSFGLTDVRQHIPWNLPTL